MKSEILSVKEKIGYGMGDAASHIIFDNVMLYMMSSIPIFSAFPLVLSAPCFYWRVRLMPSPTLVWAC
ncbi:Inner membrane symporter yicJ [Salmonella enterica subsp. enterica]|uniref:Inner membrane symporter yicJ n=1 Tax=Salmonella enterica I TaxID=59201 RepID=A0A3S4FNQ7_SALET|nr:Inner membrane symporter yicJ [Salmonella enterica subsp. enterica]